MQSFAELDLRASYRKGEQDIAEEFYIPCMSIAISYDRAVGFFSSTIYSIAWPAMKDFISRGGKIRIICSPILSRSDIISLEEGYSERSLNNFSNRLSRELTELLSHPLLNKPTKALASFVAMGMLDLKIAFISKNSDVTYNQIFHDKVGIFRDKLENMVVFKGSMNETWLGLSADGNLESVDVFLSWIGGRDSDRAKENWIFFNSLWRNQFHGVIVKPFPEVAKNELIKVADVDKLPNILDEICLAIKNRNPIKIHEERRKLSPFPHQENAVKTWIKAGCRGILEHATGSGKTFTAILALKDYIVRGGVALVLVPSQILLKQWEEEIKRELPGVPLLLAGAGNNRWRQSDRLKRFTSNDQDLGPRIVISTMQTASSIDFLARISSGEHLMIVADEIHQIGSPKNSRILSLNSGPRLGLSATPKRFGDPKGTSKILDYFGPILQPPFTLKDAINCGRLVEYEYFPHTVSLTDEEVADWREMTEKISKHIVKLPKDEDGNIQISENIKIMLINRSRIVKKAKKKIDQAVSVLANNYNNGQRWLVYCEDTEQLKEVLYRIKNLGINANEYHTLMNGSQKDTLKWFKVFGGVLVSIGCLDEGVDIPTISHALIMASSQNPRQFIQRRGRVLRRAPGKFIAVIHDLLVVPPKINDEPDQIAILKSELARAIEFAKTAKNQYATVELRRIAIEFGFDPDEISKFGFEEDFER